MEATRFIISFFAFLIISFSAFPQGQGENEEELQLIYNQTVPGLGLIQGNSALVRQVGNENEARSFQQGQSSLFFIQDGNQNFGYIEQIGNRNNSYLRQNGNSNEANLWAVGQNISIKSDQNGEGNVINAYLENDGLSQRIATLNQSGSFNKIDLALLGNGFIGGGNQTFEATQVGTGNNLSAIIDPFSSPISVIQTPGIGGDGMTLNISTSTFNFPMKR